MTPDKTPSDALAQLRHLYQNMVNGVVRDTASAKRIAEGLLSPAIAAIEKWGLPVVAVEPVAWWIPKAEQFALADKSGDRPFAKAWEPLYAAPQPTQVQAVAVPLTEAQKRELATNWFAEDWAVSNAIGLIDDYETLQGITKEGGQHADS